MSLNVYDLSKSQSMSVIMCDWSQLVDVGGLFSVFLSTTGLLSTQVANDQPLMVRGIIPKIATELFWGI